MMIRRIIRSFSTTNTPTNVASINQQQQIHGFSDQQVLNRGQLLADALRVVKAPWLDLSSAIQANSSNSNGSSSPSTDVSQFHTRLLKPTSSAHSSSVSPSAQGSTPSMVSSASKHNVISYGIQGIHMDPSSRADRPAWLNKILSMDHANISQINQYNQHLTIQTFKKSSLDCSSLEVQIALLGVRIAALQHHLTHNGNQNRLDHQVRRRLVRLRQRRVKLLAALKNRSLSAYYELIRGLRLGIQDVYYNTTESDAFDDLRNKFTGPMVAGKQTKSGMYHERLRQEKLMKLRQLVAEKERYGKVIDPEKLKFK